MALKDQVSQARGDTREKLQSIQYIEKDKQTLQTQLDEVKGALTMAETASQQLKERQREDESKIALLEQ